MAWRFISRRFVRDLGIDLGTANCLVYAGNKGIIIREPSVVAIKKNNNLVLAVGEEARRMIGRTPGDIIAIRPLREGVISDFQLTKELLRYLIRKGCHGRLFIRPRVITSIPTGTTEVERRAVIDACTSAGAREVYLIEEPVAAAIGAGLPVHEAVGNMVINIGGGTTDIAVISLGGVVSGLSVRTGGDAIDEAISHYIKRRHNLIIGERTAEELKFSLGSAFPLPEEIPGEARGRDQITGLPKTVAVTSTEIREAIKEPVTEIIYSLRRVVEETPPELISDIMHKEIVMTGGGALLRGIDELISKELGMRVRLAEDPLSCVALGAGKTLEHLDALRRALAQTKKTI